MLTDSQYLKKKKKIYCTQVVSKLKTFRVHFSTFDLINRCIHSYGKIIYIEKEFSLELQCTSPLLPYLCKVQWYLSEFAQDVPCYLTFQFGVWELLVISYLDLSEVHTTLVSTRSCYHQYCLLYEEKTTLALQVTTANQSTIRYLFLAAVFMLSLCSWAMSNSTATDRQDLL